MLTVACALPAVTEAIAGAPGTVEGITALEGAEASPDPKILFAATVKV